MLHTASLLDNFRRKTLEKLSIKNVHVEHVGRLVGVCRCTLQMSCVFQVLLFIKYVSLIHQFLYT